MADRLLVPQAFLLALGAGSRAWICREMQLQKLREQ